MTERAEVPTPKIKRPNFTFEYKNDRKVYRVGKGFSVGEIVKAGLTIEKARKLGIYVDIRRKSVHEENIQMLKKFIENKTQQKDNKT
ncbi:50S ribosomal protein L13e [Sulfolobus sp. A20]|uniref:50S ribosomal protein L13e n=1 Tax=Sulfolobaceae TaxID=118883 RepID=UPI000845BFAF|nr:MULTISPECIES: 50S ribosomal protein L13e [unclassified Sulfolobus]TRM74781.1 50S ribosomal protein L13e [Sulfolobus sp. B5]TRM75861.1 50S ribosomal protein L13e [Sulfolobus sp. E5]TRM78391.1 50S ribosomal protein L13e [Sulfolobus sp. A20-N-F8]TRM83646.1 50S ribosomal protein L13e [Sulfolobus sp. A20-N-F6]TRM86406.1 50S ribosomal protein L13e [Sulfolobus sp. A20-N-G8]TRM86456.1 50S ribosomal protein L13e [Sulfolobus sp. E3]TRM89099.1 50S ribosomal protein L13e [Sulfolobus sp. C3]TRN02635.